MSPAEEPPGAQRFDFVRFRPTRRGAGQGPWDGRRRRPFGLALALVASAFVFLTFASPVLAAHAGAPAGAPARAAAPSVTAVAGDLPVLAGLTRALSSAAAAPVAVTPTDAAAPPAVGRAAPTGVTSLTSLTTPSGLATPAGLTPTLSPAGAAPAQTVPGVPTPPGGVTTGNATAASAGNLACGSLPVISDACKQLISGTAWAVNCGTGPQDCATDVTNNVVAGAFDYFARWVAVGAIGAIDLVWEGINGTTTPVVDTSSSVFQTSMAAARSLAFPLLILAAMYSLLKRDAEIAIKSAFLYLPGAVLGMVMAGYVITALLAATDELSAAYINTGETGVAVWLNQLGGTIAGGIGVTAPILLVMFSFVLIAGSILVWLIMLVRSAAILITYAFMPLAFAAMIFPATRSWIRRVIEVQLSFILAKPVILAVLALGSQSLNTNGNALVGMMQASALFFLASFAPFALMKLIPFVSNEALHAMESPARAPRTMVASTAVGMVSGQKMASFLAGSQHTAPPGVSVNGNGGGAVTGAAAGPIASSGSGNGAATTGAGGTGAGGNGSGASFGDGGAGGTGDGAGNGGGPYYSQRPSTSGGQLASGSADAPTAGQSGGDFS